MTLAPCSGVVHLLFPLREDGEPDEAAPTPEVCKTCPPAHALPCARQGEHEDFGIWGGMNLEERIYARLSGLTMEEAWHIKFPSPA